MVLPMIPTSILPTVVTPYSQRPEPFAQNLEYGALILRVTLEYYR